MTLMVELDDETAARRALAELEAAGFHAGELELEHPFDGELLISVEAWGARFVSAFGILSRYEAQANQRVEGQVAR